MSFDTLPENISLRLQKPTLYDFILKSTYSLAFPLLRLNIKRDLKMQDYSVDVRVGTKLHEYINNIYGNDELLIYLSLANGQIGFWSYDMILAIRILSKIGIINIPGEWIKKARNSITKTLTNESVDSKIHNTRALELTKKLLTSMSIYDDVKKNSILPIIIKDIINSKKMDADTIIYRLALSIYHAKTATGMSIIDRLEDPSNIYLTLSQSEFYTTYKKEFDAITRLQIDSRTLVIKVFTALAISAYLYYNEVEQQA